MAIIEMVIDDSEGMCRMKIRLRRAIKACAGAIL
jgi:hypothetical protein